MKKASDGSLETRAQPAFARQTLDFLRALGQHLSAMSPMAAYTSRTSSARARVCLQSHRVNHRRAPFFHALFALALVVFLASGECFGTENALLAPATGRIEETNAQELPHPYLQLQGQIHAAQLAIEQSRQESREAAARSAETLSKALQSMQEAFAAQRASDRQTMLSSNQVILIGVGAFAGMTFLSMLVMGYFQWRMSQGLAKISATLPSPLDLERAAAAAALALANQPELALFEPTERPAGHPQELERGVRPALSRLGGAGMSVGKQLLFEPGALVRRRRFRAVSLAVIVGLICAAGLALLLYMVAYGRLGFG